MDPDNGHHWRSARDAPAVIANMGIRPSPTQLHLTAAMEVGTVNAV